MREGTNILEYPLPDLLHFQRISCKRNILSQVYPNGERERETEREKERRREGKGTHRNTQEEQTATGLLGLTRLFVIEIKLCNQK